MSAEQSRSKSRHLVTILMVFAVVGMLLYRPSGCARRDTGGMPPSDARIVELKVGPVGEAGPWYIMAEVADTPELRTKGLSGRPVLGRGCGMLFVFDELQQVEFWMKDTTIELSIAFLSEDGTITQIEDMQPNDIRLVISRDQVKYALEVRQGWFADRGLEPGVKVELPDEIPPPPAPEPEPQD